MKISLDDNFYDEEYENMLNKLLIEVQENEITEKQMEKISSSDEQEFFCCVCNVVFSDQDELLYHEGSLLHSKRSIKLKKQMLKDDEILVQSFSQNTIISTAIKSKPSLLFTKEEKKLKKEKKTAKKEQAALTCLNCLQIFHSRTKLFDHLKEKGHAALK